MTKEICGSCFKRIVAPSVFKELSRAQHDDPQRQAVTTCSWRLPKLRNCLNSGVENKLIHPLRQFTFTKLNTEYVSFWLCPVFHQTHLLFATNFSCNTFTNRPTVLGKQPSNITKWVLSFYDSTFHRDQSLVLDEFIRRELGQYRRTCSITTQPLTNTPTMERHQRHLLYFETSRLSWGTKLGFICWTF